MTANDTLAADLLAWCEDVKARHADYFSRIEPMGNYCNGCGEEWPCDAWTAADRLEQAVTAWSKVQKAADFLAQHDDPNSVMAHELVCDGLDEFDAVLRRMEGDER